MQTSKRIIGARKSISRFSLCRAGNGSRNGAILFPEPHCQRRCKVAELLNVNFYSPRPLPVQRCPRDSTHVYQTSSHIGISSGRPLNVSRSESHSITRHTAPGHAYPTRLKLSLTSDSYQIPAKLLIFLEFHPVTHRRDIPESKASNTCVSTFVRKSC